MEFHNKKAVIFDLDGVLCFTDRFHYQAWKMLTDRLGIPFDEIINNRLRGVSRADSLEIILENASQTYTSEEKQSFLEEKNNSYRSLLATMTPEDASPEVKETLRELKKRGYRLAIGSSSKNTRFILELLEIGGFFEVIVDGNMINKSKPDPEVFATAAKLLQLDPSECCVVEDAKAGIMASRGAGITALALFGDARECGLEDYNLTSFRDLLNVLK